MSQRTFDTRTPTGKPVRVVGGFDAQLGYHFLLILALDEIGGEDIETLFSNLNMEDPGMKVWEITAVLASRGLPYPERWIAGIVSDKQNQVTANLQESYGHYPNPSLNPTPSPQ